MAFSERGNVDLGRDGAQALPALGYRTPHPPKTTSEKSKSYSCKSDRSAQSVGEQRQWCGAFLMLSHGLLRIHSMRNWLIGYYIVEFEQHGKDRAEYGAQLLKKLEAKVNRKGLTVTLFKNAINLYVCYPLMVENISLQKSPTVSNQFKTSGLQIISKLSFSHIVEILTVDDPLVRYFYEQECIKCTWSVRELRRQISTNLYVRAGISSNPEKMLSLPSMSCQ